MSDGLQSTAIHRSLTRPVLLAGGERKLVMMVGILTLASIFGTGLSPMGIGLAIFLVVFGMGALRAFAKRDPQMSEVVQRYNLYQSVYPGRSHPVAPEQRVRSGLKSSL
jgi:type IV secretion system protein VirB3